MKEIDHLIIGAGLAGLTVQRFLESTRTVLVDAKPGRYKIGESIVPEQFDHPVMRVLLPMLCDQPSYSPKWGTIFIADERFVSFPIPIENVPETMHIDRRDLERVMMEHWDSQVVHARVESVDLDRRIVRTDAGEYRVNEQIIDCSGPAMFMARQLDDVQELFPVYATWAYFDIVDSDPERLERSIVERGWQRHRYEPRVRTILEDTELEGWSPSRATILTQVGDGVWTWQIPLYGETLLSFGAVSRTGKISQEELFEIAREHHSRNYTLEPRPLDGSGDHNRLHVRNHFATRAGTPATLDYILLSDAFGFADPVYSVGTGIAVNKAIELATLLNTREWTKPVCDAWCESYEALFERALAAFEFWYTGEVLTDDAAAVEVQDNFLIGEAFRAGIVNHYATVCADTDAPGLSKPEWKDPYDLDWSDEEAREPVARLLRLDADDGARLVDWELVGAATDDGVLFLRWSHESRPDLVTTVEQVDRTRPSTSYRTVGPLAVGYRNRKEGPYPTSRELIALLEALSVSLARERAGWLAATPPPGSQAPARAS